MFISLLLKISYQYLQYLQYLVYSFEQCYMDRKKVILNEYKFHAVSFIKCTATALLLNTLA